MENITHSLKKNTRSIGMFAAVLIAFAAGAFFQSFNLSEMKNISGSSTTNIAGMPFGITSIAGAITPVCGLTEMPPNDSIRGIFSDAASYNAASNAFQAAHPNNPENTITWGGTIGKEYLIAVINSLSSTERDVKFSYATELNGKTSIYFVGGTNDPVTGRSGSYRTYVKTGSAMDTYCPMHCGN